MNTRDLEPLWTGEAFLAATGGRPVGAQPEVVTGISIDSRTLRAGEAFFAISGDRFDGHDFASNAMRAGASVLVVAEDRAIALGHLQVPRIVVPDVLRAMEAVGRAARERAGGRIVAVTGSVGKTTTKEMLRVALAPAGSVHAADKSFNNHWGVPLTLGRLAPTVDYGVFELGMNHAGEIRALVDMVRPDVAAITRIAPAHLGQFESVEGIARAKAEIVEGVVPGGTVVLNADDEHFPLLASIATDAGTRVRTFGAAATADVRLASEPGREGEPVRVAVDGEDHELTVHVPGRHNLMNALCALAVATAAGVPAAMAAMGLADMRPVAGRGTREAVTFGGGSVTLIDESYNANPVSMAAALDMLGTMDTPDRRVAVLGDMLELGRHARAMHAGLDAAVRNSGAALVLLVGDEMAALAERLEGSVELYHRPTVEAVEPLLARGLRPGDTVMVKASNGTGLGRLVKALREGALEADRPATGP